jgi:hypothetical protein
MSNQNPSPREQRRADAQPHHTVELTARFLVPATFSVGDVDILTAALVQHIADVENSTWDDFGPDALGDPYGGAYVWAVFARCRVRGPGNVGRHRQREVVWGHGERCQCFHPVVDHECPEPLGGAPGRCFFKGCSCARYVRLSPET